MKYLRHALTVLGTVLVTACGAAPGTAAIPPAAGSLPATTAAVVAGTSISAAPGGQGQEAPAATNSVVIKNFAFSPAMITVAVGTTVTWSNSDQDRHTVTASGGAFKSPTLNTGDTFRFTFTKAGRYEYLCTIHPFMTGTVVVTP
jgi:plastocyanin